MSRPWTNLFDLLYTWWFFGYNPDRKHKLQKLQRPKQLTPDEFNPQPDITQTCIPPWAPPFANHEILSHPSHPPSSFCSDPSIKPAKVPKLKKRSKKTVNKGAEPKVVETWWTKVSKWLPAHKMHLPDDVNPIIIWDQEKEMWVDTSKNSPPTPDNYHQWPGRDLTMVYDQETGNRIDRKREMCGVSLGRGHHHPNQKNMQKLLQELAAKKSGSIDANVLAGLSNPEKGKEKLEAPTYKTPEPEFKKEMINPYRMTPGQGRERVTLAFVQQDSTNLPKLPIFQPTLKIENNYSKSNLKNPFTDDTDTDNVMKEALLTSQFSRILKFTEYVEEIIKQSQNQGTHNPQSPAQSRTFSKPDTNEDYSEPQPLLAIPLNTSTFDNVIAEEAIEEQKPHNPFDTKEFRNILEELNKKQVEIRPNDSAVSNWVSSVVAEMFIVEDWVDTDCDVWVGSSPGLEITDQEQLDYFAPCLSKNTK